MAKLTLYEQANRYLLGEITLWQLSDYVDKDIIEDMRYGVRDCDETKLASFLFGTHYDFKVSEKANGYFEEDEFRKEVAAHLYMLGIKTAFQTAVPVSEASPTPSSL